MDAYRSGRVIVGIDLTLSGLHALRTAVAEARIRGAALHAVRGWHPPPAADHGTPGGARRGYEYAGSGAATAVITRAFTDTLGGHPTDLEVHAVVVPDSPGPVLVEYACRDQDLLVLGAGRRRLLRRRWRGPVVRYCVARAHCPVLVVPPPPLVRDESARSLMRQLRREIDDLAKSGPDYL